MVDSHLQTVKGCYTSCHNKVNHSESNISKEKPMKTSKSNNFPKLCPPKVFVQPPSPESATLDGSNMDSPKSSEMKALEFSDCDSDDDVIKGNDMHHNLSGGTKSTQISTSHGDVTIQSSSSQRSSIDLTQVSDGENTQTRTLAAFKGTNSLKVARGGSMLSKSSDENSDKKWVKVHDKDSALCKTAANIQEGQTLPKLRKPVDEKASDILEDPTLVGCARLLHFFSRFLEKVFITKSTVGTFFTKVAKWKKYIQKIAVQTRQSDGHFLQLILEPIEVMCSHASHTSCISPNTQPPSSTILLPVLETWLWKIISVIKRSLYDNRLSTRSEHVLMTQQKFVLSAEWRLEERMTRQNERKLISKDFAKTILRLRVGFADSLSPHPRTQASSGRMTSWFGFFYFGFHAAFDCVGRIHGEVLSLLVLIPTALCQRHQQWYLSITTPCSGLRTVRYIIFQFSWLSPTGVSWKLWRCAIDKSKSSDTNTTIEDSSSVDCFCSEKESRSL